MKRVLSIIVVVGLFLALQPAIAQQPSYLPMEPLSKVVSGTTVGPVKAGVLKVPVITWGGDFLPIMTESSGIFKAKGLDVSLFCENDFAKQVDRCLAGDTPYLRGTIGMINAASDAFKAKGQKLVVIYQLTWSTGGDAMVVRSGKKLSNINTVAIQRFGPHMDYAANLFSQAGRLNKVQFKWLPELTLPTFDTQGRIIDPVSAFLSDASLDAVMCIIPDALTLTSDGATGTGSEGSVKGATIELSTKTASRIIADVYAVREDYFNAHRDKVTSFVQALMLGEEALRDLRANKATRQAEHKQLVSKAATLLMGAAGATEITEAMLGDCEFVGYSGNVAFFTGKGTTRNLKVMNAEIQKSFITMGIMTGTVSIASAGWDYAALATGLKYATGVPAATAQAKPKFDAKKVTAQVEKQIAAEPTKWQTDGTLFVVEINFDANQSTFSTDKYAGDFQKAMEIAQTYGGALIVVEGHSDPLGIMKDKQNNVSQAEIDQKTQIAKNLSLSRAQAVRKSFLEYCSKKGLTIDPSQFVPVGLGVKSPKYNPPRTEQEWAANRRVVFRIKQVEAELDTFTPLN